MKRIKKILKFLGPGFITGAADDDPSGIGTYSQTGAIFGYSQLWTSLFSFPFMAVVQEICGRIGITTGRGLSGVIKIHYPKWVLYFAVFILFFANTVNIGADLGAMAASAQLLINLPIIVFIVFFVFVILFLELFIPYTKYARILKFLTLSLFAYIITAFVVKQDWLLILGSTIIPKISLDREYLLNIVAIFGTSISPYLFFWQADEEVEEEIAQHKIASMGRGKPHITHGDIKKLRIDTFLGMFFSQIVMFFIILTTASTIGTHGITSIQTADQAALALKPLAGDLAFLLFAVGVIGTGLLAVPILAGSASYAISEAFGWKEGLGKRFSQAKSFYTVIAIATLLGLVTQLLPIKPFQLLYYTAILNGFCAPILLIIIMRISNNKLIMKENTNSVFSNIFGWIITIFMAIASIFLLLTLII